MNSFKQIWDKITTPKEVIEEAEALKLKEQSEKAFIEQELNQQWAAWLEFPATTRVLTDLRKAYSEKIEFAKNNVGNSGDVARALIEAKQIEKIINYVRTRSSLNN